MDKNTEVVQTEKCVVCGRETGIPINTHIDNRLDYVEGSGQLCSICFIEVYKKVQKKDDVTE